MTTVNRSHVVFQDVGVEITNSRKETRQIFEGLSFALDQGERLSILGPNGSGKSTIVDIIRGIRSVSAGSVGTQLTGSEFSHIPQNYRLALFPWLSLDTNRSLYAEFPNGFNQDTFDAGCCEFSLNALKHQKVKDLSGGEQQLLLLTLVMACRSSLYLLDEPFAAVDLGRRARALEFVSQRVESVGATLILVTHDMKDAARLTQKAIVLSGRPDIAPGFLQKTSSPFEMELENALRS